VLDTFSTNFAVENCVSKDCKFLSVTFSTHDTAVLLHFISAICNFAAVQTVTNLLIIGVRPNVDRSRELTWSSSCATRIILENIWENENVWGLLDRVSTLLDPARRRRFEASRPITDAKIIRLTRRRVAFFSTPAKRQFLDGDCDAVDFKKEIAGAIS